MLQLIIESMDEEDKNKDLTNSQLAAFSLEFIFAGFETTSLVLSFTTYLLAMNTDIQEKLQAEIDNYFEENPVITLR